MRCGARDWRRGESGAGVAARQVRDGAFGSARRLLKIDYGRCSYPHWVRQSRSGVRRAAQGGGTQGNPVGQAAALEYLADARGGRRRRCDRRLARSHRAHDSGRLWTGHRRPSHRRVSGVCAASNRTELGHLRTVRRPPQMTRLALTHAQSGFFSGGAKGTRTTALTRQNSGSTAVSLPLVTSQSRSLPAVSLSSLDGVKSGRRVMKGLTGPDAPDLSGLTLVDLGDYAGLLRSTASADETCLECV